LVASLAGSALVLLALLGCWLVALQAQHREEAARGEAERQLAQVRLEADQARRKSEEAENRLTQAQVEAAQARQQAEDARRTSDRLAADLQETRRQLNAWALKVGQGQPPPQVPPPPPPLTKPAKKTTPPVATRPEPRARPVAYQPYVPKGGREEVRLAAPVGDAVVGGGGRFLIFHLPTAQKFAVFDVQQGKVVKELPVADAVVLFAAGANQLVVVYPNAKLLHVWDLTTLERERTAPLPGSLTGDDIHQVCMGAASAGPVFAYLRQQKRTLALHLHNLATSEVRWKHWGPQNAYGPLHMRASPDGSMLVGWSGGWAGLGMALFRDGSQVSDHDTFGSSFFVPQLIALPTADGRFILTPKAILSRDRTIARVPELGNAYLVPAHEPGFFVALDSPRELPNTPYDKGASPNLPPVSAVAVFSEDRQRLFDLTDLEELRSGSSLYWERCLHYYPRAGLLISLAARERLILRRLDLVERLEKEGKNYLFVASRPPAGRVGAAYTYKLDVRSKSKGIRCKLESGPAGLQVSPEGLVTWTIPADYWGPEAQVIVTIADAAGQETFHQFHVPVVRAKED
jgi:hypothetical protein